MARDGILLESGTNEVEILEFTLNDQNFGINVLKIQAIEQFDPSHLTRIQFSHPSVAGTLLFRDHCITLVDLSREMDAEITGDDDGISQAVDQMASAALMDKSLAPVGESIPGEQAMSEPETPTKLVLVMEFNDLKTAFLVDGVHRIHRATWESISPMSSFLSTNDSKFTGSLQIDGREILLMDMEKVVMEILPGGMEIDPVSEATDHPLAEDRAGLKIFLAEDSTIIANRVKHELIRGNYLQVQSFPNGKDCYDEVVKVAEQAKAAGRPVSDYLGAIISDIEMPRMDGLAMCRNIKETLQIKDVPVIMFSSLINDQIALKCQDVGADDFITKPQFGRLVELLDTHCLRKVPATA